MSHRFLLATLLLFAGAAGAGIAQPTPAQAPDHIAYGFLRDANGDALAWAPLTIKNTRTGEERPSQTNDDGFWSLVLADFHRGYRDGDPFEATSTLQGHTRKVGWTQDNTQPGTRVANLTFPAGTRPPSTPTPTPTPTAPPAQTSPGPAGTTPIAGSAANAPGAPGAPPVMSIALLAVAAAVGTCFYVLQTRRKKQ